MKKLTSSMLAEAFRRVSQADPKPPEPDDKRSTGERELDAVCEILNRELAGQ